MTVAKINNELVRVPQIDDVAGLDEYGSTTVTVTYKRLDWEVDVSNIYEENEVWYRGNFKCPNCGAIREDGFGLGDEKVLCGNCRNQYEVWKWAKSTKNHHYEMSPVEG